MKIRALKSLSHHNASRRGLSLPEIAFAVIVSAFLLGGAWHWAMNAYGDLKINSTVQLVHDIAIVARSMQIAPKEVSRDDLKDINISLPLDLQEMNQRQNEAGHRGIFNIWGGNVWIYPGNAAYWGMLEAEKEMTVILEDVPSRACPLLIQEVLRMGDIKPMVVFVAPGITNGESLCLETDMACKSVMVVNESTIKKLCDKGDKVAVAFTYRR